MLAVSVIIWREKSACVHSGITKLPPRQGAGRIISFYFSISIAKLNTFIAGNYIHTYTILTHQHLKHAKAARIHNFWMPNKKGNDKVYIINRILESVIVLKDTYRLIFVYVGVMGLRYYLMCYQKLWIWISLIVI